MGFTSGTVDVGADAVAVCAAGSAGVRVRNRGGTIVYLGGADVGTDGYPLEPGTSEDFYGASRRDSPLVPAPPGDLAADVLYARAEPGGGISRVSWISVGGG